MSTSGFTVPADGVLISDGGLATELEARGHDLSDDLRSQLGCGIRRHRQAVHQRGHQLNPCD